MEKRVSVIPLAIVSFMAQFAIVKFGFTLVYFLRDSGFSSTQIGIATSIYPVVYLFGCLLLPSVFRSIDRKRRVIVSLTGMAFSIILLSLSSRRASVYCVLFLYGFFQSLLWTNVETWITSGCSGDGRKLTATLTLFNLAWSSSVGISNLVGGMLVSISYTLSFSIEAAVLISASVIVIFCPYVGDEERIERKDETDEPLSPWRYLAWLGVFIIYTGYSMVIVVFPQYALDSLSFSPSVSGRLLFLRGLSVSVSFLLLRKFTFWQKGRKPIVFTLLSFSLLTYLFSAVKSVISLSIVFVLYGVVFALGYENSIYHSALGGGRRHMRMVVHEVLITLGTASGSLIGSLIYERRSFSFLAVSVTLLAVFSVIISLISGRKRIEAQEGNL